MTDTSSFNVEGNLMWKDESLSEASSEIQHFFDGTVIFLTGATGFLGSLLLEKLLRSCPGVKKIYILVRPKKGKGTKQRFEEIFSGDIFRCLNRNRPEVFRKVHLLSGDCALPNTGMSPEDQKRLKEEVNCVFHFAATVRFDQKLKTACNINVRSTMHLLELAKGMQNLKTFVYCSTAYSFCTRNVIEEEIYRTKLTADELTRLVDALDDETIDAITPTLIEGHPNTYTFTKAIAERHIEEHKADLPVALVRPSIVLSVYKEPLRGWINNFYGATGILIGGSLGVLRILYGDKKKIADMVPADYVVNLAIAAAWSAGNERTVGLQLYNFVSTPERPITWEKYHSLMFHFGPDIATPKQVWYPMFSMQPNKRLFVIGEFFLHTVPAHLIDFILKSIGKKPLMVEGYKKIATFGNAVSFFTNRQWEFRNENTQNLWKKLPEKDKEIFDFNMAAFDWKDFFFYYSRGIRLYLLKDPLETVPEGKIKFRRLKIAHYTLIVVFWCICAYIFCKLMCVLYEAAFV